MIDKNVVTRIVDEWLVVLITNLQILDVVWLRMTVLGTQRTILGGM